MEQCSSWWLKQDGLFCRFSKKDAFFNGHDQKLGSFLSVGPIPHVREKGNQGARFATFSLHKLSFWCLLCFTVVGLICADCLFVLFLHICFCWFLRILGALFGHSWLIALYWKFWYLTCRYLVLFAICWVFLWIHFSEIQCGVWPFS